MDYQPLPKKVQHLEERLRREISWQTGVDVGVPVYHSESEPDPIYRQGRRGYPEPHIVLPTDIATLHGSRFNYWRALEYWFDAKQQDRFLVSLGHERGHEVYDALYQETAEELVDELGLARPEFVDDALKEAFAFWFENIAVQRPVGSSPHVPPKDVDGRVFCTMSRALKNEQFSVVGSGRVERIIRDSLVSAKEYRRAGVARIVAEYQ